MCEKPILFSAPMVRAILEGRKTQTRRVVKRGQVFRFCPGGDLSREERSRINASTFRWERENPAHPTMDELLAISPYGAPGDRLIVRESLQWRDNGGNPPERGHVYAATPEVWVEPLVGEKDLPRRSIPSIHMPRWASRIALEVLSVRVERLNEISSDDAIAEMGWIHNGTYPTEFVYEIREFSKLWESINGSGSWATNPWVWVVEFKRVQGDTLAVFRGGE